MVTTVKFSEFKDAGITETGDTLVGLEAGENVQYQSAPQLLAPGTTAERPLFPSNGDLRFNTDLETYEFFNAVSITWVQL